MSREVIKAKLLEASMKPGVYKMSSKQGKILYVGKAKNIKNRLSQYLRPQSNRIEEMIRHINRIDTVNTSTETEALILEANLIKELSPKYNILFKDDKSYPFIFIDRSHDFPKLYKYRGKFKKGCHGPFTATSDVIRTIGLLRKAFLIRSCPDSEFASRVRPCIEYQMNRCSAPCTNLISSIEYKKNIDRAQKVLNGEVSYIQQELLNAMNNASKNQEYESAIIYRDRLRSLETIRSHSHSTIENGTIIIVSSNELETFIYMKVFKDGYNHGTQTYFIPKAQGTESETINKFLLQSCMTEDIYLNVDPDQNTIDALGKMQKINLRVPKKGIVFNIIKTLEEEAEQTLSYRLKKKLGNKENLKSIARFFCLKSVPQKVEVYDNSHISGSHSVGVSISVGHEGFIKSEYRKYNIQISKSTDDYGMMREVITRRLKNKTNRPDFILIDGGIGHLNCLKDILTTIPFASISKGQGRKAGEDKIHTLDGKTHYLNKDDPLFKYLQVIRDEAHRFAINSHRQKRNKAFTKSSLDSIPGIGPKRKKILLTHFGSIEKIKNSNLQQISSLPNIDTKTAKNILESLKK